MDLKENQISQLRLLNSKLVQIELEVKKEILAIQSNLDDRVISQDTFPENYNIECHVTCLLREDLPDYESRDDKIIAELIIEKIMVTDTPCQIGSGANVNIFKTQSGHALQNENHCWLFRCLYEEAGLSWDEITCIGKIWVDIDVSQKKNYFLQT